MQLFESLAYATFILSAKLFLIISIKKYKYNFRIKYNRNNDKKRKSNVFFL